MATTEKKYHDASLQPPRHHPPADSHRPASCLLDFTAYIADRTNGTTASCEARGGRKIQVTFFFVDPPGVSHLCVSCPGFPPTEFASEPRVVATEADLVLIRVVFGQYDDNLNLKMHDLYIYKADGKRAPVLRHVPHPIPFIFFQDHQLGLLTRYEDGDLYYIAALHKKNHSRHRRRKGTSSTPPFEIHLFSSKTGYWTAKPALLDQQHHDDLNHFHSTKVVTVGGEGGAVAWVDLWRGFLQCNVLDEIPKLHYVPLPPPLLPKNILSGSPWLSRDVAVIQGCVKYVELQIRTWPGTDSYGQYIADGWMAVVWSRAAPNPWEDTWHEDLKIDSDHISAEQLLLDQLPKLQDIRGRPEPTLQRLHVGQPTLSLHDDSVVYLMAKVADWDDNAWVLAVDMAKGALQLVAKFSAERTLGISFSFMHSRISSYVSMEPGSRQRDGEVMRNRELLNKLHTSIGVSSLKPVICIASCDELIKLCSALSMSNTDHGMVSECRNEPIIVIPCPNELVGKLCIMSGESKSNKHIDMLAACGNEVLDMLRPLAELSNHELSMALARGVELLSELAVKIKCESRMTSESAIEHHNNLSSALVYAGKAVGAKMGSRVAGVHLNSITESTSGSRLCVSFAIAALMVNVVLSAGTATPADPAVVFSCYLLLVASLLFVFIVTSGRMSAIVEQNVYRR